MPRASRHLEPDHALIHQELKRPGVTLQLLWEEYAQANLLAYKHTSFCVKYREWASALKRSMRQVHVGGDKLFADYAGHTVLSEGRAFIKGLRYNLHRDQCVATVALTDAGEVGTLLFVIPPGLKAMVVAEGINDAVPRGGAPVWVWQPASEAMPRLPAPAPQGRDPRATHASKPSAAS